jgi:hypothetical protein
MVIQGGTIVAGSLPVPLATAPSSHPGITSETLTAAT